MADTETTRAQDIKNIKWYRKASFPWLIISHVAAFGVGVVIAMNIIAYNNAAIQSAVDARAQSTASLSKDSQQK